MLKRRIKGWFLKRLGIKIYAADYQTSYNDLIELSSEQENRFFKIKEESLKIKLAELLPITIITTDDPHSGHIKKSAYIYAMEIKE